MAKLDPHDAVASNEYRVLCMHVGHLFISWATLETILAATLKIHLGMNVDERPSQSRSIQLASAVYGSLRYKASVDAINRILVTEPRNAEKERSLAAFFAHIGNIGKLRDYFAHQSTSSAREKLDGTWRISTLFSAKDLTAMSLFEFETDAVNVATRDLTAALEMLRRCKPSPTIIDYLIGDGETLPTWRYKPSMLKSVGQKPRNPRQER